jgi:hypothetical protein
VMSPTLEVRRLVFVDEMGTNTSPFTLHAYFLKSRRAYAQVPRNRGSNTTLLANMSLKELGPCLAVERTTSAPIFVAYVKQVLASTLKGGQIVVMDNLSVTRSRGSWS